MKLYTIKPVKRAKEIKCSHVFHITMEEQSIPNYGELERWLRDNFTDWFCLIAHLDMTIAVSGVTFNREKPYVSIPQDKRLRTRYYELRCNRADAALLKKVWRIPAAERRQNEEYLRQRRDQEQGWVRANGKLVPIRVCVSAYEASLAAKRKAKATRAPSPHPPEARHG